jgi:hypothetical protein
MDSMSPVGVITPSSTSALMTPLVSFLHDTQQLKAYLSTWQQY